VVEGPVFEHEHDDVLDLLAVLEAFEIEPVKEVSWVSFAVQATPSMPTPSGRPRSLKSSFLIFSIVSCSGLTGDGGRMLTFTDGCRKPGRAEREPRFPRAGAGIDATSARPAC
jgi:hypothetical protein